MTEDELRAALDGATPEERAAYLEELDRRARLDAELAAATARVKAKREG